MSPGWKLLHLLYIEIEVKEGKKHLPELNNPGHSTELKLETGKFLLQASHIKVVSPAGALVPLLLPWEIWGQTQVSWFINNWGCNNCQFHPDRVLSELLPTLAFSGYCTPVLCGLFPCGIRCVMLHCLGGCSAMLRMWEPWFLAVSWFSQMLPQGTCFQPWYKAPLLPAVGIQLFTDVAGLQLQISIPLGYVFLICSFKICF